MQRFLGMLVQEVLIVTLWLSFEGLLKLYVRVLQVLKIIMTRFCWTSSDDLKKSKFLQPSAEDYEDNVLCDKFWRLQDLNSKA